MSNRLTRIYTRTGDDGSTGLADGSRVSKDDPRVEMLGCLDELNSQLGVLLAAIDSASLPELARTLSRIQHRLFEAGAEIATPGARHICAADVESLEADLDSRNRQLPPLREFILPGGSAASSQCHLARAVCRRVERRLVGFARSRQTNPDTLRYINRLSDLLFVFARVLAREGGSGEVYWRPRSGR
jgi:cob(I)alamin adenosyltransferase